MNITLTGFMGTGKTVAGRRLAKRLGWRFVDVDGIIETAAGKTIPQIFAEHGEAVFRRLEQRAIRRAVKGDQRLFAAGGGAFVDPANRSLLRTVGPVICLSASPQTILRRVKADLAKRPMLAPTTPRRQSGVRSGAYAKADLRIATDGLSVDEAVERIWDAIGPWVCKGWQYLVRHNDQLIQRYSGQYIAVLNERIVGVGPSQLKAYQAIPKASASGGDVAIFYIPLREESPTAF